MELSCVDCGEPVARPGITGPIPRWCAECTRQRVNAKRRDRYAANREAEIASSTAWNRANADRKKSNAAAWYVSNREKEQARKAAWYREHRWQDWVTYIKRKYNLTLDDYMAKLDEQGGTCRFCPATQGNRNGRPLYVDHDHSCCPGGKSCGRCVRFLLCAACNTGLGHFGDDLERMRRAVSALEQYERLSVAS